GTAHEDMTQTNTTLVVVATDYPVDQNALIRMAIAAHDAIARTIRPAHTIFDGDTVFVLTIEEAPTDPARTLRVATATERVVERAICASTNPDGVIR
ncbi:MAG: P1 family peptidase, partial [Thermomicrobium sp.]|nr:P1 family peptidase [Thermomicrobium sp.]